MMAGVRVNGDPATWNENTSRGVSRESPWTALWRARELVGYFALKDLRLRYRQAALGVVWVLAQPIASVTVFTLVFSRLAGVSSQGIPYPLFALVGMVTWTYFSSTVVSASTVLASNVNLVTKVYFPRIAAPASSLLPPGVDLGVSLLLVGVLATYYGIFAGVRLLLVPAWLLMLVLTAAGVALWVSALNVRYRDVQHAVTPLLQLWLFASPVAYGTGSLTGWQQAVYALNPMVGPIEFGRFALTGTPWPGWSLAVSAASAAVVLVTGIRYFGRAQRSFADVI
ncbi:ABC-2 type transport system permease protein [Geodermatophilus obscurus]|jgi:ABC-2 type transport system permease protein/lipopolysaccharide transport system permease protein|uniref:Transport permease protein n=2 Tax=Geodermatophilus obscurus TaxID=1861 RepID=A0A1I5EEW3_9ACTN|nr:ABC-2 type transport system permease protein [Geodermatophilus obscurus]